MISGAKRDKPSISIVLSTTGRRTTLEGTLRSLQKQGLDNFETILVYTVLPSRIQDYCKTNGIVTLKEDVPTPGARAMNAARNLGAKHARADIVVFTDDDCVFPETWLERINSVFVEDPLLSGIGGAQLTPPENTRISGYEFAQGISRESDRNRISCDRSAVAKIGGCNAAYRKEIFEKVGCFDELPGPEDYEFNIRLVEKGYHIRYDPSVFVWHHRHGLNHLFWTEVRSARFYLSRNALKYSKYDVILAKHYFVVLLFPVMALIMIVSPVFFVVFSSCMTIGYVILSALRSKTYDRRAVYFTYILPIVFVTVLGFYFGLLRYVVKWFQSNAFRYFGFRARDGFRS